VSARRAQLGGVSVGGGSGATVVHVELPAAAPAQQSVASAETHEQQIERAMALPDGGCARLAGGMIAYAGHRLVRDGARVALVTIPQLLRFDVHPRADCFSFNVRNLNGLPVRDNAQELPVRPYYRPDGPPLNEYELQLTTPEGYAVCIVVRVPPYFGALEHEYAAVALLS
jgi:hypothetical protein